MARTATTYGQDIDDFVKQFCPGDRDHERMMTMILCRIVLKALRSTSELSASR